MLQTEEEEKQLSCLLFAVVETHPEGLKIVIILDINNIFCDRKQATLP